VLTTGIRISDQESRLISHLGYLCSKMIFLVLSEK
jgi:hypothetical protein